ncbi:MAG: amidohydrolase family protein [Pseudomonadota bacterium]
MAGEPIDTTTPSNHPVGIKYWRIHRNLYVAVTLGLLIANVITGAPWWSFWPIFGWGVVVMFHFFLFRSINIEDEWVDSRAGDLRSKSYDFSHINDIQSGYVPIIDAHHHFWDVEKNYHPWLCDEPLIESRHGDYRAIRKNYLPEEFARDTTDFRVVGSVYIETEWDPSDPLGETQWIQSLIEAEGLNTTVVASAALDRDDVDELLAEHAKHSAVRGIRHKPNTIPEPAELPWGAPGSMSDNRWLAGYAKLRNHALSFDLQVPYWHLPEAVELAKVFPDTLLILNHTGLPNHRHPQALRFWRTGLRKLAELPNTALKISGLGEPHLRPWTIAAHEQVILDAIEEFGVERCMFASNYPVESLYVDYGLMMRGYFTATREFSAGDKEKLFLTNAARYYRMEIPEIEDLDQERRFGRSAKQSSDST